MSDRTEPAPDDRASALAGTKTQPSRHPVVEAMSTGSDIIPYVVPMFVYVGLTSLEAYLPQVAGQVSSTWYPIAYAAKLIVVALLIWRYRATLRDYRPFPGLAKVVLGVATGLFVCLAWIALDGHYPALPFMGGCGSAFDPFTLHPVARFGFIAGRTIGLVLVVPVCEELFCRIVSLALDNRHRLPESTDRQGDAPRRGRHFDTLCACAPRMAAGSLDWRTLGLASVVDHVALGCPPASATGQPVRFALLCSSPHPRLRFW